MSLINAKILGCLRPNLIDRYNWSKSVNKINKNGVFMTTEVCLWWDLSRWWQVSPPTSVARLITKIVTTHIFFWFRHVFLFLELVMAELVTADGKNHTTWQVTWRAMIGLYLSRCVALNFFLCSSWYLFIWYLKCFLLFSCSPHYFCKTRKTW